MAQHHSDAVIVRLADPPPDKTLHGLWKPYVYRGQGFDIFNPDDDDQEESQ